jgi:hypothetical protein
MDLTTDEIKTIIWATGYRPDYSWLELPVLDRKGMIRHDGGVVCSPGVYLMGTQFLSRRKSALVDGAGDDARDLSAHLASYLDNCTAGCSPKASPNFGPLVAAELFQRNAPAAVQTRAEKIRRPESMRDGMTRKDPDMNQATTSEVQAPLAETDPSESQRTAPEIEAKNETLDIGGRAHFWWFVRLSKGISPDAIVRARAIAN